MVTSSTEIPVNYCLRLRSDGWFVYDVDVENISMIIPYREIYRSVVRQQGVNCWLQGVRAYQRPPLNSI